MVLLLLVVSGGPAGLDRPRWLHPHSWQVVLGAGREISWGYWPGLQDSPPRGPLHMAAWASSQHSVRVYSKQAKAESTDLVRPSLEIYTASRLPYVWGQNKA